MSWGHLVYHRVAHYWVTDTKALCSMTKSSADTHTGRNVKHCSTCTKRLKLYHRGPDVYIPDRLTKKVAALIALYNKAGPARRASQFWQGLADQYYRTTLVRISAGAVAASMSRHGLQARVTDAVLYASDYGIACRCGVSLSYGAMHDGSVLASFVSAHRGCEKK